MLSDGGKLLVHGKRDLDTMEMFGITGQMMGLGILSFSRYVLLNLLLSYLGVAIYLIDLICNVYESLPKTWVLSQSGYSMLVIVFLLFFPLVVF
jgi:uncharacterized membrane protein YcgQ (UPF0703/DUF1980 family)